MQSRLNEDRSDRVDAKSPAEIPPPQNRKHLTEPSWIENMIYFTGAYLEREARITEETEASEEENPPKSEAA